jgi:hypothetical protein
MAQNLKHVGRIIASGKKVLVAFRTLPGDAYSCLVVATESLPDELHNAIINLVDGPMAQESYEFGEALDRSFFPDGSRMLPNLHATGRLIKVPTTAVEMTPVPGVAVVLSELNQLIAEQRGIAVDELHVQPSDEDKKKQLISEVPENATAATTTKTTNTKSTSESVNLTSEDQAKQFRSEADKLSKQAAELRRKAEELVPTKKKAKEVA